MSVAAVIFDMDGVLIDSEPIHFASLRAMLARRAVDYDEALHATLVGKTDADVFALLRERAPDMTEPLDTLVAERHADFLTRIDRPLDPMPGVIALLERLAGEQIPVGCANSSHTEHVERILTNLGVRHHFRVALGGDRVEHPKPAPDIYLRAAEALGVDVAETVVFEDSAPGTQAARAAGAWVVAVPCPATVGHDLSAAHQRVGSLLEVGWPLR